MLRGFVSTWRVNTNMRNGTQKHAQNSDGDSQVELRCKPYIQPFERVLAAAEVRGLLGTQVPELFTDPAADVVTLESADVKQLQHRLTYWETIQDAAGRVIVPDQIYYEQSDEAVPQVQLTLSGMGMPAVPKRRKLRYGAHDLHEYRGKFFPQLVRSLMNSIGLQEGSIVLDPTCGSGTTNVEARSLGMTTLGVDLNPLSVFIARVKTSVFSLRADTLSALHTTFLPTLTLAAVQEIDPSDRWDEHDVSYLQNWFDPNALKELAYLLGECERLTEPLVVDLLKVCVSNIVRTVSWQNDDDLRVRKKVTTYEPGTVLRLFKQQVSDQLEKLIGLLSIKGAGTAASHYRIVEGNALHLTSLFPEFQGKVDAIITSPPYATALPYIDTDRLSLVILGLLPRTEHRHREFNMIGNREVLESQRVALWKTYQERRTELPVSICSLIDRLAESNHSDSVGFRRRNLPALLSKYFLDMLDVMRQCYQMMTPGGYAFFVVGNNSTNVDGEKVEIATDEFLWELGETAGWTQVTPLNMELLPSRDIFRNNRGSSETILVFRAAPERTSIYGQFSRTQHRSDEWDFADEDTQEHLHSIHPYPARFIPQIPRRAILEYSQPGDLVLDPFAGSGTTLLEASLLERPSIGVDNNAVAHLVSRAKIAQYTADDVKRMKEFVYDLPSARTFDVIGAEVDIPSYKEVDYWFDPEAKLDLGYLRERIRLLPEPAQTLALATLSSIIVRVSYQDSDTRYAKVDKPYTVGSALKWYKQKLSQAIRGVQEISNQPRANAATYLADTRSIPFVADTSVQLIVTSPPYLNAYDYHKYHRHRLHWIDGDVELARDQEIGKHDTFTRKQAVPEPFFDDMTMCFQEWRRVLRPSGYALIVIGDSIVSGQPVPVGDRFVDILQGMGFTLDTRWIRTVKAARKSFNSHARIQQEHVLLFKKQ